MTTNLKQIKPLLKPTKGRLILKEIEVENKTAGGILLTSDKQDTSQVILCEVIEADEKTLTGVSKVYIGKHSGYKIQVDGVTYLSVIEQEIIAYLED